MFRKFLLKLLAPTIARIDDVVLTRDGKAYWIKPSGLIQMRVYHVGKIKETK